MKNIKIKAILILFSLTWFSCNDEFLTLVPEDTYSVSGAYKTEDDFKFAIAGVYAEQQEFYAPVNENWFVMTQLQRSDDTRNGAAYSAGIDQFTDDDSEISLRNAWQRFYRVIYRSNLILEKIEEVEFDNAALKDYIKGEAYALRAWSYFNAGYTFGGVPLITSLMSTDETLAIPRSTQEATFKQAEDDYMMAISLLPDAWNSGNVGRITKYAAEGGLARAYMFQSKFALAAPLLKDIIDSGNYGLEPDYTDAFDDGSDNGIERVWEIQFHGQLTSEATYGGSAFIEDGNDFLPFLEGTSNGAQYPSLAMMEAYEPGDMRKDISAKIGISFGGVPDNKYHRIIKYSHYTYVPVTRSDWATNYPVIRYADVVLMYAECLNEAGYQADGDAFVHLNSVRNRAGLADLTSTEIPNQAAFRNAIKQERRVEFAFEGRRWQDLIRWGDAVQVMNEHFKAEDEGDGLYKMSDHQVIYAIPSDELARYNNTDILWQNPGY